MIENLLKESNCIIIDSVSDWRAAVHAALSPLIEQGYCTDEYEKAVYDATEKLGPYYVLSDTMALIHATSKAGVRETQMAVTVLRKPVRFSEEEDQVRILIALAAVDPNSHLDGMAAIMNIFGDDDSSDELLHARSGSEIYKIFSENAPVIKEPVNTEQGGKSSC
jgi:PTS system ascorbate-specific IIA component